MASNGNDQYSNAPLRSSLNNYTGKNVYHHKIVLLGDMGVGKTCISIRYVITYQKSISINNLLIIFFAKIIGH